MLWGAESIRCVPKPEITYKSTPMPNSHVPSLTHARNESGGIFSPRRRHGLISGGPVSHHPPDGPRPLLATSVFDDAPCSRLATSVLDGNHRIAAATSPRLRCAVADADGDHGKRRHIVRPGRVAVAHNHQQ